VHIGWKIESPNRKPRFLAEICKARGAATLPCGDSLANHSRNSQFSNWPLANGEKMIRRDPPKSGVLRTRSLKKASILCQLKSFPAASQ
jgi:hypothetical protein